MATQTAQIIIDIDNKSLLQLNDEIKQLEASMQGLAINSAEWQKQNQKLGTLKTQFANATQEAQKLQKVVEKVGGAEQLKSIAKLGQGMVGAFAATNGALTLLGKNSETFDQITAKAATFMAIMGGLNAISETFSKENLKGLINVGKGFGTLVRSVKTASMGMKAALISTGIGALVVGVGLLIANWDKLTKIVSGSRAKEQKALEDNIKKTEQEVTLTAEKLKQKQNEFEIQNKINDGKSEEYKQALKNYEVSKAATDAKQAEVDAEQAKIDKLQDEFNNISRWNKTKEKADKDAKQAEIDIATSKKKTLESELLLITKQEEYNKIVKDSIGNIDAVNNSIAKLNDQLTILNSKQNNSQEIFKTQTKLINEQIKAIKLNVDENGKLNENDKKRINSLEAQKIALKNQNIAFQEQLKLDNLLLELDIKRAEKFFEYNNHFDMYNSLIIAAQNDEKNTNVIYEDRVNLIKLIEEGLSEGKDVRDSISNFDLKRNEILEDRLKRLYPSEAKVTTELYNQLNRFVESYKDFGGLSIDVGNGIKVQVKSVDDLGTAMNSMYETTRKELEIQGNLTKNYDDRSRKGKEILDDATQQLILIKIQAQAESEALQSKINSIGKQINATEELKFTNLEIAEQLDQELRSSHIRLVNLKQTADAIKDNKDKQEEYNSILQKINAEEQISNGLAGELYQVSSDITSQKQTVIELDKSIVDTNKELLDVTNKVGDAQENIGNELENQLTVTEKLKSFVGGYAEEIAATGEVISKGIDLIAGLQDRKAEESQRRIDGYKEQLDGLQEAEDEHQSKLLEYEQELQDANGSRYNELLTLIQQEKNATSEANKKKQQETDILNKKIAEENKKRQIAEHKAAVWRKAQAIIDATIAGLLAVVKALPNLYLAAAVGIAAALDVGLIASQKVPPVESFAKGGTTKTRLSLVGEEGPELVSLPIGTRVYNHSDSNNILSGNKKIAKFADGGFVTPDTNIDMNDNFNYERLNAMFLNGIKQLPNPQVSVLSIIDQQNSVEVTKTNAGLSRG